jgi:hypothetical protein
MIFTYLKGLFFGYKTFRYNSGTKFGTYGFGQWLANVIRVHANNLELDVQYHKDLRKYWVVVRDSNEYLCIVKLVEVSEKYKVSVDYNPKRENTENLGTCNYGCSV